MHGTIKKAQIDAIHLKGDNVTLPVMYITSDFKWCVTELALSQHRWQEHLMLSVKTLPSLGEGKVNNTVSDVVPVTLIEHKWVLDYGLPENRAAQLYLYLSDQALMYHPEEVKGQIIKNSPWLFTYANRLLVRKGN